MVTIITLIAYTREVAQINSNRMRLYYLLS